jgi:uncharacterized OsmC-like protein
MRIVLESEEELLVKPTDEPLAIEATSPELSYSAFHMLGSALGTCVLAVLSSWAEQADISADQLSVGVKWHFADDPHRVDQFEVKLHWPDLPAERTVTAQRVADLCGIHETLTHQPEIHVHFETGVGPAA